jgi:hypothetical protein
MRLIVQAAVRAIARHRGKVAVLVLAGLVFRLRFVCVRGSPNRVQEVVEEATQAAEGSCGVQSKN